jgi:hypothetical protein
MYLRYNALAGPEGGEWTDKVTGFPVNPLISFRTSDVEPIVPHPPLVPPNEIEGRSIKAISSAITSSLLRLSSEQVVDPEKRSFIVLNPLEFDSSSFDLFANIQMLFFLEWVKGYVKALEKSTSPVKRVREVFEHCRKSW